MWEMVYQSGTVVLKAPESLAPPLPASAQWDGRVSGFRADAHHYRDWLSDLIRGGIEVSDQVRAYDELELIHQRRLAPHGFQRDALKAWEQAGRRGVVVLPTGSGKTYVAEMAIAASQRSSLVLVPTIDLLSQWYERLRGAFGDGVGIIGGGEFELQPLTVITYQSAARHLDRLGNRFGLIIFDECHHLPSPIYAEAARAAIAPFRLGLTATLERPDEGHLLLDDLIGPVVYRQHIDDLSGDYLAEYQIVPISVSLDRDDFAAYQQNRQAYLSFIRQERIRMFGPSGWERFLAAASRSHAGRRAFKAYREARRIAFCAPAKMRVLESLLCDHRGDRIIIFTNDNHTVYQISQAFLIPAITHQTPAKERRETLLRFNDGRYPAVVTSRVLNEGVDVPEANVAIIVSGSATVREHVQRLGRILRKRGEKQAVLYELITSETLEVNVSARRKGAHA